ncbi:hypothetical protein BDR07DRAFT_1614805, partial [Suillus spraguei]
MSKVPSKKLEVLYVRWLAPVTGHRSGMHCARFPKVAFVEESDPDAFGFLDPAFVSGRGTTSLRHGESLARQDGKLDDWEAYYVGIFADKDMYMRYTPYGIGHPTVLREMTRNCANVHLVDNSNLRIIMRLNPAMATMRMMEEDLKWTNTDRTKKKKLQTKRSATMMRALMIQVTRTTRTAFMRKTTACYSDTGRCSRWRYW